MADLYADENFNYEVVDRLRALGHKVLTVQEAGQQRRPDADVLAYAMARGRAVLTLNRRHFVRLHSQVASHAGIIVCTDDDADVLTTRIDQAVAACPALENQLLRVDLQP
jgi:predicted nuclease of predicted toxin-antitoxin system